MARIAGVDLPKDKRIEIGLTYVYGIGRTSANKILAMTGHPDTRVKDLPRRKRPAARVHRPQLVVEGTCAAPLRWTARSHRMAAIAHAASRGLPVHGQRHQTNARNRKVRSAP